VKNKKSLINFRGTLKNNFFGTADQQNEGQEFNGTVTNNMMSH